MRQRTEPSRTSVRTSRLVIRARGEGEARRVVSKSQPNSVIAQAPSFAIEPEVAAILEHMSSVVTAGPTGGIRVLVE